MSTCNARALSRLAMLAFALIGFSTQGLAQSAPFEFSGSGFLTLGAGRLLSGTHDPATDLGYGCPCFISDFAQNGVYESGALRVGPDSKLGLQGTVASSDRRLALTGQVVSRGSVNGKLNLEWLYGSYDLTSQLTLQVGRKRLPLFSFSEVQDVGFALPWIHLPPQVYGWEVVNFNGASLIYRDTFGAWTSNFQLFMGHEQLSDAGMWKIYNGKKTITDVRWSNILGLESKFAKDGLEGRFVYIQSDTQNRARSLGEVGFSDPKRQRIYGVSVSYDVQQWTARAEFLAIDRREDYGFDHAQLLSLGYRFGQLTPYLSYSNYRQGVNDASVAAEAHDTLSFVLRYDLSASSALKLQFDRWRDRSDPGYGSMHGNARLITVSYDKVF